MKFLGLTVVGTLLLASSPHLAPAAQAQDWQARIQGQWVSSASNSFGNEDLDDGVGLYLGVERRLSDRWGIEVGVAHIRIESEESISNDFFGVGIRTDFETELAWTPVTVAGNFHLTPHEDYDVYVAPRVGLVFADDVDVTSTVAISGNLTIPGVPIFVLFPGLDQGEIRRTTIGLDDAFLYGLRLGFDKPFAQTSWGFSAAMTYDVIELDGKDVFRDFGADLDPFSISLGLGYRW